MPFCGGIDFYDEEGAGAGLSVQNPANTTKDRTRSRNKTFDMTPKTSIDKEKTYMITSRKSQNTLEDVDMKAFLCLLEQYLNVDAGRKITPKQALQHTFITMTPKTSIDKEKTSMLYEIQKHDVLSGTSSRYEVLDFIGEGSFGKVVKCVDLKTDNLVAIKIGKGNNNSCVQNEAKMLETIRKLDSEKENLVTYLDDFNFHGVRCLAFEMLDMDLYHFMIERDCMPLTFDEIRLVTHQLLVALDALKRIGIVHTDIKTDNIMLVNHKAQPFMVKLIDFGMALKVSELEAGDFLQPYGHRAPEVILGLPLSEAIDMWGLGCVIASLYFGRNFFPGESSYEDMKYICQILGQPGEDQISAGINARVYFSRHRGWNNSGWKLNSPEEYEEAAGLEIQLSEWWLDEYMDLEDAVTTYRVSQNTLEDVDKKAFLCLLEQLLDVDAERRITPKQALEHTFFARDH